MKIRTLTACLLAVACVNSSVSAQICANTGVNDNSIAISGSVLSDEAQVVLIKPGFGISDAETAAASTDKSQLGNVIEYFGQVTASDKSVKANLPMRTDAAKGKYLIAVDNDTYSVYFATFAERLGTMTPAAKAALTSGSFASFAANDGKYFCNGDLYDKLSDSGSVAGYAATILNEYKTLGDAAFLQKITSALNMGVIMEALNENKISDLPVIKAMTDVSGLIVPLDKIDLIKTDSVQNIVSDISGKSFASPDAYKKLLSESIFINVINNAANMLNADKKAFFDTYAGVLGLDLTSYNKLTDNKKIEAVAKLSAEGKTTVALLQKSLDEICKDSEVTTSSTGGGSGSGGSGDSGFGIRVVPSTAAAVGGSGVLSDLSECKWAQPAIEYLVSSQMISGYGDNTFKPTKTISRAEFITIIARKYLPSNAYAQSFADVSSDKWCFNYVESAYHNGIISGMGSGTFAPDANISRQDMAVILCRLAEFLGREISGTSTGFADDASMSSYAKDAIYRLKSAGIVNGDENGKFNPNASATRAEAAQMIYSFVKFLD